MAAVLRAVRAGERGGPEAAEGSFEPSEPSSPALRLGAVGRPLPSPQGVGYAGLVLGRLVELGCRALAVERASLVLAPPGDSEAFTLVAAYGEDRAELGSRYARPADLAELAMSSTRAVVARSRDGQVWAASRVADSVGARGALSAGPFEHQPLERELALLAELACLAGQALVHHDQRELSAGDSRAEIRALATAFARADGDSWRHAMEVAGLARVVGEEVGLRGVELIELDYAAQLHDLGKLRLPPGILRKPGPLSAKEWDLVRLHPEWGAEMVARVPGLEAVALLVRLHHERHDGAGYPHGIAGTRIPFASRIIGACDAYGAMTGERPYREPILPREAVEQITSEAGGQFDPRVTWALRLSVEEAITPPGPGGAVLLGTPR